MGFFLTNETTVKPLPRRKTPVMRRQNRGPVNRQKCTESPFGVLIAEWGPAKDVCPFRFSTKYYDHELEQYYYGYRYYDPAATKWLCRDPLGLDGGWNETAFCRNDPVNFVDPDGKKPWESVKTRIRSDWQVNPETGEPEVARWRRRLKGLKIVQEPIWQKADGLEKQWFFDSRDGRWVALSRAEGLKRYREWVPGTLENSRDQFMGGAMTYPALVGGGGGAIFIYKAVKSFTLAKLLPPLLPFLDRIHEGVKAMGSKVNDITLRVSVCRPFEFLNEMANTTSLHGNHEKAWTVNDPYILPTVGDIVHRTTSSPVVQSFASGFSQDVPQCHIQPTVRLKKIWLLGERGGDWIFQKIDPNAPWGIPMDEGEQNPSSMQRQEK